MASLLTRGRAARYAVALLFVGAAILLAYYVGSNWTIQKASLHDLQPVYYAGRAFTAGAPLYAVRDFAYPPSAAMLLGAPLAQLSFTAAARLWLLVSVLLIVATVVIAARIVGRTPTSLAAAAALAVLAASLAVREVIGLGNVTTLIGFLGAASFLLWARDQDLAAGTLFGLSLSIKPILAPLILGLLILRRWRALIPALALPVALNLVAFGIDTRVTAGMVSTAHSYLTGGGLFGGYFRAFNSSLRNIGGLLSWPVALAAGLRVIVGIAAISGAVAIWRWRPEPYRSLEAGGLLLAGYYLSSAVLESHWILVLVPFALAAVDRRSPVAWWPVAVGAFFAADLVALPHWLTGLGYWPSHSVTVGLGLALVVVATAVAALRTAATSVLVDGRFPPRVRTLVKPYPGSGS